MTKCISTFKKTTFKEDVGQREVGVGRVTGRLELRRFS